MLDFSHRSSQKEMLDESMIPYEDLKQNLVELNIINTWLGGHSITFAGVKKILNSKPIQKKWVVLEIGCGGGDNLNYLKKKLGVYDKQFHFIGVDLKSDCIEYAKCNAPDIEFICSDYQYLELSSNPDIIFSSLFCHHFTNEEMVEQLHWMKSVSKAGFFINDLHRHSLAYLSIKFLTQLFSKSYLVKNDAPLSVARGFRKTDWNFIFRNANIAKFTIQWKWAFRHLIVFIHE